MNQGEHIHGFTVQETRPLPELEAVMVRMEHDKSGARLVWLDRKEENKTFAIAFRTLPEDDTGVFHILEHSVLCGSDKYPVKEPFVELFADIHQRLYLPRQDHVPCLQPERQGFCQPGPRLHGRGAPPADLS